MVDEKFLTKLSQNLVEILGDDEYYDINIEVGNDPYVKVFHAHMVILKYRSPYLRRILSTNKKKNDGTLTHIKLPNISPGIFQIILRYIYGGRLPLEEYETLDIIKILVAANELSLQELFTYLQTFLIENKANWMELNFNLIYQTSFENDSFLELQKYCTDLMTREPDKMLNSINFSSIPETLMISLIQNDNLQMSAMQVWDYVLKWGLAQNPGLPSDPTRFSKEDFNSLKNNLQQYIPFIKFYDLTSEEFSNKVLPYKKILPKELYKDLLRYFLNPNNNPIKKPEHHITEEINQKNIDSNIITIQHTELISKWIDRRLTSLYEFNLLFRASRDGFAARRFHEICDNQFHTVTIVKVRDSSEILGGYNPIAWKSDNIYGSTKDSFIFSFKDKNSYILSRVMKEAYATRNKLDGGPLFGKGDLSIFELSFFKSSNSCKKSSYEKLIRETEDKFFVEECEVFQIIRNCTSKD